MTTFDEVRTHIKYCEQDCYFCYTYLQAMLEYIDHLEDELTLTVCDQHDGTRKHKHSAAVNKVRKECKLA